MALWCAANGLRVACVDPSERALETAQEVNEQTAAEQVASLHEVRRTRDGKAVVSTLHALREACRNGANVMPPLIEAVKAYATVGEISDVMRDVFETWQEPAVF